MRINYKIDWQALGTMSGSKKISAKKQLILESALKIIATKGLQNLSVTEVARSTELSKPLVLYHYETKERILEDICFFIFKMGEYFVTSSSREEESFEVKLRNMVRAYFRWNLFNDEVSEIITLLPHFREKSLLLKRYYKESEFFLNREWERIFLESLRYRSLEELKISVFGVRSLLNGALNAIITSPERVNYQEQALRLKFNLETNLKVELPSFDF
jgi:AcrR family transcriptional regulator